MPIDSSVVVLYDVDGNPVAVQDGVPIPAGARGELLLGSDGTNARILKTDVTGALSVAGTTAGVVSTNNSSTATLGGGAAFTGTGDEVKDYAFLTVEVFSDQASAAGGLVTQWSSDNTNWDVVDTGVSVAANVGQGLPIVPKGRYFRVVYTNGATPQGAFRLSTVYHPNGAAASGGSGATEATLLLIKAKTDNLDVALSTRAVTGLTDAQLRASAVPVSAASLPLPTGAATAALQTQPGVDIGDVTINNAAGAAAVNIQDGGNSITVDGPLTDAQLRASAVPVSAAALPLPTGASTAALQTQPGVDIGDVTVNNAAGAAAVNIQDGGNSITVDGPLTDAQLRASAVPVSAASLPLPTGAATETTQASQSLADNAAFTDGTTQVTPAGFVFDEVAGTALTENDAAAARIDSKRAQVHVIEDATTRGRRLTVSAGGAALIDGTATTQPVSSAAASQIDGHSASIGATTDADTALTVIGRLKKLVALIAGGLPAALVGGRLDTNLGAWLGSTTPTVGQKTMAASLPMVIASDQPAIPISGSVTASNASIGTNTAAAPSSSTQIGGPDGSGNLQAATVLASNPAGAENALVTRNIPSGTQPVSAASLPLPSGAATEATLALIEANTAGGSSSELDGRDSDTLDQILACMLRVEMHLESMSDEQFDKRERR